MCTKTQNPIILTKLIMLKMMVIVFSVLSLIVMAHVTVAVLPLLHSNVSTDKLKDSII